VTRVSVSMREQTSRLRMAAVKPNLEKKRDRTFVRTDSSPHRRVGLDPSCGDEAQPCSSNGTCTAQPFIRSGASRLS